MRSRNPSTPQSLSRVPQDPPSQQITSIFTFHTSHPAARSPQPAPRDPAPLAPRTSHLARRKFHAEPRTSHPARRTSRVSLRGRPGRPGGRAGLTEAVLTVAELKQLYGYGPSRAAANHHCVKKALFFHRAKKWQRQEYPVGELRSLRARRYAVVAV